MNYYLKIKILFVLIYFIVSPVISSEKIKIVTTLTDLQSIAELIGGDKVEAFAIAKGYQNPHFVDPKPSYILKLSNADIFITIGLDLETGWVPSLINSARNPKVLPGGEGYIDASLGIDLLQIPSKVDRSEGDIHIYGNPHYWLKPDNGKKIAQNIYSFLIRFSPDNEKYFAKNLENFNKKIDKKIVTWMESMKPYKGRSIIAYHNEWPYFEDSFGLKIVDFLEPKPGIPPTPSQLAKIISIMKKQNIKVIINSPYFQAESADLVARETEGKVITLATSVEAFPEIETYYDLFDYNLELLVNALKI